MAEKTINPGVADDIWAQHVALKRIIKNCTDRDVQKVLMIASEALSAAGSICDSKLQRQWGEKK